MKRIQHGFLMAAFFIIASSVSYAQKKRAANPHAPGEDIYKHYTGTIGTRKVTLDLRYGYQGASNYGGSTYYYPNQEGTTLFYIYEPETFDHNVTLTAGEQEESHKLMADARELNRNRSAFPKWKFTITGNKLTGKWYSPDGIVIYDINLTEDYSRSYPMDVIYFRDTSSETTLIAVKPSANTNSSDADFITSAELNFINGRSIGVNNWPDYFTGGYAKKLAGVNDMFPVYNDNGFLVLMKSQYTNKFPVDDFSFLCLDVLNKRILTLNDILNIDETRLSALLEKSVRKNYNLDPNKELSAWFLFDKIPVSEKIMIGNKGINFYYAIDEVIPAKDYQDKFLDRHTPIKIFLSYDDLKDMLKDDFKKRVGI